MIYSMSRVPSYVMILLLFWNPLKHPHKPWCSLQVHHKTTLLYLAFSHVTNFCISFQTCSSALLTFWRFCSFTTHIHSWFLSIFPLEIWQFPYDLWAAAGSPTTCFSAGNQCWNQPRFLTLKPVQARIFPDTNTFLPSTKGCLPVIQFWRALCWCPRHSWMVRKIS